MLPTLLLSKFLTGMLLVPASSQAPGKVSPAAISKPVPQATTIAGPTVTPAVITFLATDPDGSPVVSGSSGAVISWSTAGSVLGAWTLKVNAPATFGSCPTVPVSAVTVSCGSVTGGFGGACSGNSSLSTTPTQVAGGTEGLLGFGSAFTVNLTFTLADSWKYIASSLCSLSVTYTITAN